MGGPVFDVAVVLESRGVVLDTVVVMGGGGPKVILLLFPPPPQRLQVLPLLVLVTELRLLLSLSFGVEDLLLTIPTVPKLARRHFSAFVVASREGDGVLQ